MVIVLINLGGVLFAIISREPFCTLVDHSEILILGHGPQI